MITILIATVAVCLAISIGWIASRKKSVHLPPGPPGEFLLGNARQIQLSRSWDYFTGLAKQYGDVMYFDVVGQPMVVLSSLKAIEDLVVKKSSIFSARPVLTMAGDLVGWKQGITALSPSLSLTVSRKLAHQWLGPSSVARWDTYFETEMRSCVGRALRGPRSFLQEFKFSIARIMLDKTYGISPKGPDDEVAVLAEDAAIIFGLASQPGKFLVDSLPWLKYVPPWFPFAEFRRLAAKWRVSVMRGINVPFEQVTADVAAGIEKDSFVSQSLRHLPTGATDDMVKWAAGTLYAASVDTTTATISTFLLNMVLHPDVQDKGRAEIYRVVGADQLPTITDRDKLPYVEAILKEVLRWHPIVPTGVPYRSLENVEYRGWKIPRNSVILANIWAVARDPHVYSQPDEFLPERFQRNPELLDPRRYFYGFGRRICPGQYLADAVLWLTIATMLATVKISKKLDEEGNELTPLVDYQGAIICTPATFPYALHPVSSATAALLADSAAGSSKDVL